MLLSVSTSAPATSTPRPRCCHWHLAAPVGGASSYAHAPAPAAVLAAPARMSCLDAWGRISGAARAQQAPGHAAWVRAFANLFCSTVE